MIWLRTRLYGIVLAVAAVFAALLYRKGRQDANDGHEAQELQDYHDTRKRIDQIARDGDPESAREWLSERGKR